MTSAEIITIGTEILLGEIVDTNTRYIARVLRGLGVDLYRTITIGDNVDRIAEAIHSSVIRADIVITTGGLGPTVDDPTREAVAQAFEVELEYREELWEQIGQIVGRYGRVTTENQKRQAYMPKGAKAIKNNVGTAPCFVIENEHGVVISLPGVPKEMEHILHEEIIPYLKNHYTLQQIIKVHSLRTAGAPEAHIDEKIAEFETHSNPTVGLAAHSGIVDIRISAKADSESEADQMITEVEMQIRERLGSLIFGSGDDTLEGAVLGAASDQDLSLMFVESGLGGGLKRRLAKVQENNLYKLELAELSETELLEFLSSKMNKLDIFVGLGISAFPIKQKIELVLITPEGSKDRNLEFGGHPDLITDWSINIALNWLRRSLQGFE